MKIQFRYSQNRWEIPSRCDFKADFSVEKKEADCGCVGQPFPRKKQKLISLPFAKRYFGYEKCTPDPYHRARIAKSIDELNRFYTQSNCCKK